MQHAVENVETLDAGDSPRVKQVHSFSSSSEPSVLDVGTRAPAPAGRPRQAVRGNGNANTRTADPCNGSIWPRISRIGALRHGRVGSASYIFEDDLRPRAPFVAIYACENRYSGGGGENRGTIFVVVDGFGRVGTFARTKICHARTKNLPN